MKASTLSNVFILSLLTSLAAGQGTIAETSSKTLTARPSIRSRVMSYLRGGRFAKDGVTIIPAHYDRIARSLALAIDEPTNDEDFIKQLLRSKHMSVDAQSSPLHENPISNIVEMVGAVASTSSDSNSTDASEEHKGSEESVEVASPLPRASQSADQLESDLLLDAANSAVGLGKLDLADLMIEKYRQMLGIQVLSEFLKKLESLGHSALVKRVMSSIKLMEAVYSEDDLYACMEFAISTKCKNIGYWSKVGLFYSLNARIIIAEEYQATKSDYNQRIALLEKCIDLIDTSIKNDSPWIFYHLVQLVNDATGLFTFELNRDTREAIPSKSAKINELSDLMSRVFKYGNDPKKVAKMARNLITLRDQKGGFLTKQHVLNAIQQTVFRKNPKLTEVLGEVISKCATTFNHKTLQEIRTAYDTKLAPHVSQIKQQNEGVEVDPNRASFA